MAREKGNTKTCSFEGCDKPVVAYGLCNSHRWQQKRGQRLQPLRTAAQRNRIEVDGDICRMELRRFRGEPGKIAIISISDLERVRPYSWFYADNGYEGGGYAGTCIDKKLVRLHDFLLRPPAGMQVDHIDGDGLNCRRENMRIATRMQNAQNAKVSKRSKTGVRNVSFCKGEKRYRVRLMHAGKTYSEPRSFGTLEEAAEAAKALRARLLTHHVEERCKRQG